MAGLHNAIIGYKQKAMNEIIHDADIVKALDPNNKNPEDLIYNNIFPYFRVPVVDTETRTYITICIDYPEEYHPENFMREICLKICIIVHQYEMETDWGATRLDYISAKVDDIFTNSRQYGRGKLRLLSSVESSLDETHRYREMLYVSNETQGENCLWTCYSFIATEKERSMT